MIIKKVRLENIRSYEEAEIEFPLGSILLTGDIGSGKTSVLLAIEFALFGLQPGQKGTSLLRNGTTEGKVILEIDIDGNDVIIERSLKKGKSVNQSEAFITINGKKYQLSITELKNKILELINYPKEFIKKTNFLYRFTVYTPQEEMKQIILESTENRLNTLRYIFGVDKYKRIVENVAIITSKLREIIREWEGEIKILEGKENELAEKRKRIDELKKELESYEKLLKEITKEKKEKEKELEEIKGKIEEKENYEKEAEKTRIMLIGKKELDVNLKKENDKLLREIEELKKAKFDEKILEELEKEKKKLNIKKDEVNQSYLDISSKINTIQQRIEEIKRLKNQISSLKVCPTCLQDVKEEYKVYILNKFEDDVIRYKKQIEDVGKEKEENLKLIKELDDKISQLDGKINELKILKIKIQELEKKEKKILEIEKERERIVKDIEMLEKQLKSLKEASFSLRKYEVIHANKEKELDVIKEKEKGIEIRIAEIKKELEVTLQLIDRIEKEIYKKKDIEKKLNYVKEIENYLSTHFLNLIKFTEKNMMLKLREEFSKLFSEWFSLLVPENFSSYLDENFTPIIEQQGFQLDYSFLSGGERTAVALSYRLALNQLINSFLSKIKTRDIIILDEPTDGFSEQQLDKVRDVLQQLNVKQLIIVSHEPKIESFVEHVIRFKKEHGITRIE